MTRLTVLKDEDKQGDFQLLPEDPSVSPIE